MLTTLLGNVGVARRQLWLTRERRGRVGLSLAAFLVAIICLGILPAQAMVDTGLIGYWSFDSCSFADDSGNGHDGVAGVGSPDCVLGPEGHGMAYAFNGTDDSIVIPGVEVSPAAHSYTLWFSPAEDLNAASPRQDLLYRNTADFDAVLAQEGRPHITLNHEGFGKVGLHPRIQRSDSVDSYDAYNDIGSSTTSWQAGRWYHVAFTWDGSEFRVYIDGQLQQTVTHPAGPSFVYQGIVLGMRGRLAPPEDFPFYGRLDEVRMYNDVLSPAEVAALAATMADPADNTGTIQITKLTDPAGESAAFEFTLDDGETILDFSLSDGDTFSVGNLQSGNYVVSEAVIAAALGVYDLNDITCVEDVTENSVGEVANRRAVVALEPNETVLCTFTNVRQAVNLIPEADARVETVSRWLRLGAEFDPSRSRQADGSGSVEMDGTDIVQGPAVSVSPGQEVVCGLYFQGGVVPTTVRVGMKILGSNTRNASGAQNWPFTGLGEWQLATFTFTAEPGDSSVRLLISRPPNQSNRSVPMWIDDVFCTTDGLVPDPDPDPETGELIKIMPLGDSVTQANTLHQSFRRPLWKLLQAGGFPVDFVGSLRTNFNSATRTQGPNPFSDFDLDHEGHWGWRSDEILSRLPSDWASSHRPDVVLLLIGGNDVNTNGNKDIPTTIADLGRLIDVLRAANPDVTILFSKILPTLREFNTLYTELNAEIPGLVDAKNTAQSPVILVERPPTFQAGPDTYDNTHPNTSGENKLAENWYEALVPVLEGILADR